MNGVMLRNQMNWKKAHIISKWIFVIGFAPIQYIIVGTVFMLIILSLVPKIESILNDSPYGSIFITILAILGFLPYLFFVINRLKETSYDDFSFHFSTVKVGIIHHFGTYNKTNINRI